MSSNTDRNPADQAAFALAVQTCLDSISPEDSWRRVENAQAALFEACLVQGVVRPDEGATLEIGEACDVVFLTVGDDCYTLERDGTIV